MYSYEDRLRAVRLYIKLGKRVRLTIRQLGYPTKNALKSWYREFEQSHDLPAGYARRPRFTEAQRERFVHDPLLSLSDRVSRMSLFGSGGCGKATIINFALTPLFTRIYGPRGFVKTAFANKPSRLIHGRTSHSIIKIR